MRLSQRLTWLFAVLFLLAGGTSLLLTNTRELIPETERALAGTTTLFLGGFALCLAWHAWETGAINVQYFNYTRAGQPGRFAASVIMVFVAGIGTLGAAAWFFFFE